MQTLLTGFSGTLGSAVAPRLVERGCSVRVLLHGAVLDPNKLRNYEIIWGSLSQPMLFDQLTEGIDAVVHCAWDSRGATDGSMEKVNLDGTMGLLDAAERSGVKIFIYISSVAVYGLNRSLWGQVLDEDQPLVTKNDSLHAYPRAKVVIDNELAKCKSRLRMSLIIIRPGLLFTDEIAPAKKLIRRKSQSYGLLVGKSENHLPYIHVNDVAEMVCLLLDKVPTYEIYNAVPTLPLAAHNFLKNWAIQTGIHIRIVRIPRCLLRMTNWSVAWLKKMLGRQGGGNMDYQIMTGIRDIRYSADKAVKELGWQDRCTNAIARRGGN